MTEREDRLAAALHEALHGSARRDSYDAPLPWPVEHAEWDAACAKATVLLLPAHGLRLTLADAPTLRTVRDVAAAIGVDVSDIPDLSADAPDDGLGREFTPDWRLGFAAGAAASRSTDAPDGGLRAAAVAMCQLWFTDNAVDGSPHLRKAMLDLRAALAAETPREGLDVERLVTDALDVAIAAINEHADIRLPDGRFAIARNHAVEVLRAALTPRDIPLTAQIEAETALAQDRAALAAETPRVRP